VSLCGSENGRLKPGAREKAGGGRREAGGIGVEDPDVEVKALIIKFVT